MNAKTQSHTENETLCLCVFALKTTRMEEKKNLALGKINFIMLAISMVIVVIGFVMMSGASSDTTQYNPEIFSAMRIKVAPVVCFVGFVSIIAGIMYRPKQK